MMNFLISLLTYLLISILFLLIGIFAYVMIEAGKELDKCKKLREDINRE